MIELLGVGARRADGDWLLHRVCARFHHGEIALVVSWRPEERLALLDAVAARLVPEEGRVWVSRHPVARDTVRRVRALVAEVDLHAPAVGHRSLLWNVLVAGKPWHRALGGLLRLPGKPERRAALRALDRVGLGDRAIEPAQGLGPVDRARLALAGALARRPEVLVVREIDAGLDAADADLLRGLVRAVVRSERVALVASARTPSFGLDFADRLVAIADGLLVFDGPPAGFMDDKIAWRFGTA